MVTEWLKAGGREIPDELIEMQEAIRSRIPVFHWMIEFPEVFYAERPDPLDGGRMNGAAWMDAFVGNPPFMGGSSVSSNFGNPYRDWLLTEHPGSHGNSDLSAHFFRRASHLLGSHGTIGLAATNTIAQGDTRATGLQWLTANGLNIFSTTRSMPWPGEASVAVTIVHIAKGGVNPLKSERLLDGTNVDRINSYLEGRQERNDPTKLAANLCLSFLGAKLYGQGFVLSLEEVNSLTKCDPRNAEKIFPYIGGEELNTSPLQKPERYAISFGQSSLAEAQAWPELIKIIAPKVKPERDLLRDNADGRRRKLFWWQYGRDTPGLNDALSGLQHCLVTCIVTKHLMFSLQPTKQIFSHKLYVFPLASASFNPESMNSGLAYFHPLSKCG